MLSIGERWLREPQPTIEIRGPQPPREPQLPIENQAPVSEALEEPELKKMDSGSKQMPE